VTAHAYEYATSDPVTVTVDERTRRQAEPINFELRPATPGASQSKQKGLADDAGSHRADGFQRPPSFSYHHYDDMKTFLAFYAHTYPNLTRLYSIGKSVNGKDLWVMEISDNPGVHEPLEPG
jgi:carboxypeptidase D